MIKVKFTMSYFAGFLKGSNFTDTKTFPDAAVARAWIEYHKDSVSDGGCGDWKYTKFVQYQL